MSATSSLGCGFDYPHIRDVVHCDLAHSVIDQYQEDSQGGRDGEACNATTFLLANRTCPPDDSLFRIGVDEVYTWSKTRDQCHYIIPSLFLDGVVITCMLLPGAELCDYCKSMLEKPPPSRPYSLPSPLNAAIGYVLYICHGYILIIHWSDLAPENQTIARPRYIFFILFSSFVSQYIYIFL